MYRFNVALWHNLHLQSALNCTAGNKIGLQKELNFHIYYRNNKILLKSTY